MLYSRSKVVGYSAETWIIETLGKDSTTTLGSVESLAMCLAQALSQNAEITRYDLRLNIGIAWNSRRF
jgi:hypothetical protein